MFATYWSTLLPQRNGLVGRKTRNAIYNFTASAQPSCCWRVRLWWSLLHDQKNSTSLLESVGREESAVRNERLRKSFVCECWQLPRRIQNLWIFKTCLFRWRYYDCHDYLGDVVALTVESDEVMYFNLWEVSVYGELHLDSPCWSNPCGNGGSCEPNGTFYRCVCPASWPGLNCEGTNWAQGKRKNMSPNWQ